MLLIHCLPNESSVIETRSFQRSRQMGPRTWWKKPAEITESVLDHRWEAAILISNCYFANKKKPTSDWLGDWKVDYVWLAEAFLWFPIQAMWCSFSIKMVLLTLHSMYYVLFPEWVGLCSFILIFKGTYLIWEFRNRL